MDPHLLFDKGFLCFLRAFWNLYFPRLSSSGLSFFISRRVCATQMLTSPLNYSLQHPIATWVLKPITALGFTGNKIMFCHTTMLMINNVNFINHSWMIYAEYALILWFVHNYLYFFVAVMNMYVQQTHVFIKNTGCVLYDLSTPDVEVIIRPHEPPSRQQLMTAELLMGNGRRSWTDFC